jgi:hypothetical protein
LYESFHCLFYTFRDSMLCCFIDCEFNIGQHKSYRSNQGTNLTLFGEAEKMINATL